MKTQKPKTPAEALRFQGGICQELQYVEFSIENIRQTIARSADAMSDYEDALKQIAERKDEAAKIAATVLKKYRF